MTSYEGGCHCKRVRFRANAAPKFASRCHCDSCRRTTGGAYSTWVGFDAGAVEWTGEAPVFYASSMGVKRGFCPSCGTPVSYESDKWPGERHFLIGVFDDPRAFTPTGDYLKEEALAWVRT
ncbi:MAG: GFA family protein [Pseudomonadota bacterium]